MAKFILFLSIIFFASCNSDGTNSSVKKDSIKTQKKIAASWSNNDEMEFMDNCVEGAKERLGEEKAFNQCKCILRQLQEKNPTNDSTASISIMSDTAQLVQFAKKCQ
jgi:hypothetical protein